MILDVLKEVGFELFPCRVYDAKGTELHEVRYCDTETGYVRRLYRDGRGELDASGPEAREVEEWHPAPLTVVPINRVTFIPPDKR